jgi:hypothetical protein
VNEGVTVAVTDHAVERFRQRVSGGSGALDVRPEIAGRVARAWAAGRVEPGERGAVNVADLDRRDVVYVCRHDRPGRELIVITLWEEGDAAAVPRRYTDELRRLDRLRRLRPAKPTD